MSFPRAYQATETAIGRRAEMLEPVTILTQDVGAQLGWAVWLPEGIIISDTQRFHPTRFEGGGMMWVRYHAYLSQILAYGRPDSVFFEEIRRHNGTLAAQVYGGFLAILSRWCEEHKIPYQGVPVGTWKRFVAKNGNASKADVMRAVESYGFNPSDHNEADAIALLLFALSRRGVNIFD